MDLEESNALLAEGWPEIVPDNSQIREWQWSSSLESDERRMSTEQNVGVDSHENTANEDAQDPLHVSGQYRNEVVSGGDEATEQSEPSMQENDFPVLSGSRDDSEANTVDRTSRQDFASEVQQWQDQSSESEEREWDQDIAEYTEWRDIVGENADENQQQPIELGWSVGNEERENSRVEDDSPEEWQEEGGFQEAVESWLDGPSSDQEAAPARRSETFYFPDDENVYSREIRELLSRCKSNPSLPNDHPCRWFQLSLTSFFFLLLLSFSFLQKKSLESSTQRVPREPQPADTVVCGKARQCRGGLGVEWVTTV